MRRTHAISLLAVLAVLLGACAGSLPGISEQGTAGISHWQVEVCTAEAGAPYVCEVEVTDGKDKGHVEFRGTIRPDGTVDVHYVASDVVGSMAIAERAAAEVRIVGQLKDLGVAMTPAIVEAVRAALLGPQAAVLP